MKEIIKEQQSSTSEMKRKKRATPRSIQTLIEEYPKIKAQGYKNDEIADMCGVSVATLYRHIKRKKSPECDRKGIDSLEQCFSKVLTEVRETIREIDIIIKETENNEKLSD